MQLMMYVDELMKDLMTHGGEAVKKFATKKEMEVFRVLCYRWRKRRGLEDEVSIVTNGTTVVVKKAKRNDIVRIYPDGTSKVTNFGDLDDNELDEELKMLEEMNADEEDPAARRLFIAEGIKSFLKRKGRI